jgi:ATP-dependent RNA helicase DHX37/DHR1
MYSRHMDSFALPEVLTRPLEDIVLAMKAMAISNVARFPFPTAPDQNQLNAAVKLLANLGCIDLSDVEEQGGDGSVTRLGQAVAKLPLGVRYGKMLLIAAQAGVLDYAIAMVSLLSENSPFLHGQQDSLADSKEEEDSQSTSDSEDEHDTRKKPEVRKWMHRRGDVLAGMLAVGAYTYAGRGAGGSSEKSACKKFCSENGLNFPVMDRIQKMRLHLARLAKIRFCKAEGVAARTGGIVNSMRPPNRLEENLLCQAISSGLLDNVAMLAPPGSMSGDHPYGFRSAYMSCLTSIKEPLYMDPKSALFSRDWRQLPQWVCYDKVIRKSTKDGTPVVMMKNITPIDPSWLGTLARGSYLLRLGDPLSSPLPSYDANKDAVLCSVLTKFGNRGWEIPPMQVEMYPALQKIGKQSTHFLLDDSFRWFARFLLEGKVLPELKNLAQFLNDEPSLITRKTPASKVALLVSTLAIAGIDSAGALRKHWAEVDNKFLFSNLKSWTKPENVTAVKEIWMTTVQLHVKLWKDSQ